MNGKTLRFRFKRFEVEHQRSAMKIGFDGVLLGAWADVADCRRILDIGSGCGLISLMIAQRTERMANAEIHSVEVDEPAYLESIDNFSGSPWHDRITAHHCSIQDFARRDVADGSDIEELTYDLIVCNPPFFDAENNGRSRPRDIARHGILLSADELFQIASRMLAERGRFGVIFPVSHRENCVTLAQSFGLICRRCTIVKPNPLAVAKRVLLEFQFGECDSEEDVIAIEADRRHEYSNEFIELTRDFYLKM